MKQILLVEDEDVVAGLIIHSLSDYDFQVTHVDTVEKAEELLVFNSRFDAILLDRQLPGRDGLSFLKTLRVDERLKHIPVILETGMDDKESIREGLVSGAFYYLTKPIDPALLVSVISAAIEQYSDIYKIRQSVFGVSQSLKLLDYGVFYCRTLEEVSSLAQSISLACPNPSDSVVGFLELLVNAVEHGNLEIDYAEKTQLKLSGRWDEEINRRLNHEDYSDRTVKVELDKQDTRLQVRIMDQGKGFDWKKFINFDPERAFDPNGRGIAMAKMMSFADLHYNDAGNEVTVYVELEAAS